MKALRAGLGLFFVLIVAEGALRKWAFPAQQQLIFIAKDVLIVALSGLAFAVGRWRVPVNLRSSSVQALLILYALWVLGEAANPALPNFWVGLWGVKSHLLYIALVFLVPAAFPSPGLFHRWLERYVYVALPVLLLGVAQFFAPVTSPLNKYATDTKARDISTVGLGGHPRITGTFPYMTGMVTYVFAVLVLALALLTVRDRRRLRFLALCACVVLGVVVAPMTGARWLVYIWAIVLPLLLVDLGRSRFRARVATLTSVLAVAVVVLFAYGSTAAQAFSERAASAGDDQARVSGLFANPGRYADMSGLLGFGAGATNQAAPALAPGHDPYEWLPTRNFENEPERAMLELGALGFLALVSLKLGMWFYARSAVRRASTPEDAALAAAAASFFLAHLATPTVYNATANALYWGFAGALMVAPFRVSMHARTPSREPAAPVPVLTS